ncbi:UDP-glucuronosyltransferase 2B17 [Rattus norvegicus]|uniref:UDP-glucuronosyltransferase 2B17 n=1 Tax=Rattus norvegicus TaxID=10116 RepID=UPI0019172754|nr:UDP-glucuronosyltransferase 2B17 [Rattus norvegicus]
MVGIPMFGEQHDNIAHMVAKGAAVTLNIRTMSKSNLFNALKEIINNPFYKKNAVWLSTIHHDQPMKPLDKAVFWIEFVMRHKGAKHLRPLGHNLPWYQYHSLDVIGFLLTCSAVIAVLTVKSFLFIYRLFVKKEKKMKNE